MDEFAGRVPEDLRTDVSSRLPDVYRALKSRATGTLRRLPPGQTLTPTELCHEAYLKLSRGRTENWMSDAHFVAAATIAMRQITIDRIRARDRRIERVRPTEDPEALMPVGSLSSGRLTLMVDALLERLEQQHERAARLVSLRYFLGLTEVEAAEVLGITERTVRRDWTFAKAWLLRELSEEGFVTTKTDA
ncbi:MAG: ECF-type sigma factor [Planctomycetota bacterium]